MRAKAEEEFFSWILFFVWSVFQGSFIVSIVFVFAFGACLLLNSYCFASRALCGGGLGSRRAS